MIAREDATVTRTDKWEVRIYRMSGVISFHRLRIRLGEIVPDRRPVFTLRASDFRGNEKTLLIIGMLMLAYGKRGQA